MVTKIENEKDERMLKSVRKRWDKINWEQPLPHDFIIPEIHYMELDGLGLSQEQRVLLNRLFACFSCELFIHFEGYLIEYLGRYPQRIPVLSEALIKKFIAEELIHSEMFYKLLNKLRPDLYPGPISASTPLYFLSWDKRDKRVLKLSPVGTFFLLAWLFEEITLFVPRALEEHPQQSSALVKEIMCLHALEEEHHVKLDMLVMSYLTEHCARWKVWLQTIFTLPVLLYVNVKIQKAWEDLLQLATKELNLTEQQRREIQKRGPSQSDRWGMESFIKKIADTDLAGVRTLCWVLKRELR